MASEIAPQSDNQLSEKGIIPDKERDNREIRKSSSAFSDAV
jgi:hypothetical protein